MTEEWGNWEVLRLRRFPDEGAIEESPEQVPLERSVGKELQAEGSACTKAPERAALSGRRELRDG